MKYNTYKIYTLGCKVNQYDSVDLRKKLECIGFGFVTKNADWAIINTCAVTKNAIRKDRQMISKARNENPEAKIVLFGCFPKAYKDEVRELGVDYIFGVREGEKIVKLLSSLVILERPKGVIESRDPIGHFIPSRMTMSRSRYFLKIQDGCEQFCTYCIIPYTRGKLTSREERDVLREVEEVIKSGVKEIVLTGIHLGLYGQDNSKLTSVILNKAECNEESQQGLQNVINRNPSLSLRMTSLNKLIKKILKNKDLKRLRLSSIEISEVSDELVKSIKNNSRICNHLHIPLQSGSEKILKSMNRPYDKKYFQKRIEEIKKQIPDIAISTDVIVGFPGEGDNEFKETYDFIKTNKFSKLHVFPYSVHEKTPAFKFPEKVKENVKISRAKKIRELGNKLEKEYQKKFTNKNIEVLIENIKNGIARGKSEYYIDYMLDDSGFEIGDIVKFKVKK